jgi:hypothetical protein
LELFGEVGRDLGVLGMIGERRRFLEDGEFPNEVIRDVVEEIPVEIEALRDL